MSMNDECLPFYVSLRNKDMIVHNYILYSRASNNVMAKAIMDQLGLMVTKAYLAIIVMDNRQVPCHVWG